MTDFPESMPPEEVGQRLRHLRDQAGLDQQSLARLLDVSVNSIGRWERGEQPTPLMALARLAWHLRVPLDYALRPVGAERIYAVDREHIDALRSGAASRVERQLPLWVAIDAATEIIRERSAAMALAEELSDDRH